MCNNSKNLLLISIAMCFALVASACAATEPVAEPTTTQTPTTEATTTTEPLPDPRLVYVPDCDDASDCAAGFVLNETFYFLDCTAINEGFVTTETLGEGEVSGTDVTVNLIKDVDPSSFVAISLPGGQCADGEEVTSPWSIAFDNPLTNADRDSLCEVGLLTEAQLIANACIAQLIPTASETLPPETVSDVNNVMRDFLGALPTDNAAARELWSGFPSPGNKNAQFAEFVRDFEWIKTRNVRWEIAGPAGTTGAALVIVTDDSDQGAAFVVSPSTEDEPALIQRLPEPSALRFAPKDRSVISGGITVSFAGTASAGEVKAYLAATEIAPSLVTRSGRTVSVQLPEVMSPLVIVTIVSGDELPTVTSSVYFFRG